MRRVLIVGCGYVGRAAAALFLESGWKVEAWRRTTPASESRYPIVACDVSDQSAVGARAAEFDLVIHCVSSNGGDADAYRRIYFTGAKNLLDVFPDALLLFTSSTSVYAQRTGEWVTEDSLAEPTRETARVLRDTEELVLAHGGIVARLAGIYGPGRSFMLKRFLEGTVPASDRYINQVHRDDVATALLLLANKPARAAVFNLADDVPMLSHDCYAWLARFLQKPLLPTRNDSQLRKRGDSNKRVSNRRLREYGWELRYPRFEVGMAESVIPHWNASCSASMHAPHQT